MLMCQADVFYRSRGNVSNFVEYMRRNRGMEVVDMVKVYETEHPWVKKMRTK